MYTTPGERHGYNGAQEEVARVVRLLRRALNQTASDSNIWVGTIESKPTSRVVARHVRLTATKLRKTEGVACLAMSQIVVTLDGRNIAVGAKVSSSDGIETAPWLSAALTDGLSVPGTNPRANSTLPARREFSGRAGLKRAARASAGSNSIISTARRYVTNSTSRASTRKPFTTWPTH